MPPVDGNSLIPLAISPGVASSSLRRRSRARRQRGGAFPLSVEHLERRDLLAGLIDLTSVDFVDELRETPAIVLEDTTCVAIESFEASQVPGDDLETNDDSDVVDESPCKPDGDARDPRSIDVNIENLGNDWTEIPFGPQFADDYADLFALEVGGAAAHVLRNASAASQSAEVNAGPIFTQQTAVGTSAASTARRPEAATADASPVLARPTSPSQPPIYFSGSSSLGAARWKVSAEELADADSLLDIAGLEERSTIAPSDTVAVAPPAPAAAAELATTSEESWNVGSVDNDLTVREVAFSQVQSWTEDTELAPTRIANAHELSGNLPPAYLVEVLQIANDAADVLVDIKPPEAGESAANELAKADIAPPFGRVPSWCVLGGVSLCQIILSVRARQRKQSIAKLA